MIWIAIIVAAAIGLAAALYAVWPMIQSGPAPIVIEDDRLTELIGRKDTVLVAIKDLEFDYHVGKVSEEDYQQFDRRLRQQAIGLFKQIEQITPQSDQADLRLEKEITRLRKTKDRVVPMDQVAPVTSNGDGAPAQPAAGAQADRFCTSCGEQIAANHKFCANCGEAVSQPVAVTES